eukprot:4544189-Pyramimonas_sp.AAC.1
MIKLALKRAPAMSWHLLSARVTQNKYCMRYCPTTAERDWLIDTCCHFHGEAKALVAKKATCS